MLNIWSLAWWTSKVLGIAFLAFTGVFASNWANDFKKDPNIFSLSSFQPFIGTLLLGVVAEGLSIYMEKQIKEQEKQNDPIYIIGQESIKTHRQKIENTGVKLQGEKLRQEIENTKLEIEQNELNEIKNRGNNGSTL